MKQLIKWQLIIMLSCYIFLTMSISYAATSTGHKEFTDITFLYNKDAKLLVQMTNDEKEQILDKVKRKAFGWSVATNYANYLAVYESGSVFSRSNNTSREIALNYATSKTSKTQLSIDTSGGITLKASGKIDAVSLGLDQQIRNDIGVKTEVSFEEDIDFDIVISPGKKVSILVKGMATVSNGAGKFYIFGIPVNKGCWEYVDVENEYYELYEEEIPH